MEDRVKMTLKQLRDLKEPSNCSIAETTADCASEVTSQSLIRDSPESPLDILPSCSSSSVSESPARQPSLPLPSLSDEDKKRDDELVANILKKLGWN